MHLRQVDVEQNHIRLQLFGLLNGLHPIRRLDGLELRPPLKGRTVRLAERRMVLDDENPHGHVEGYSLLYHQSMIWIKHRPGPGIKTSGRGAAPESVGVGSGLPGQFPSEIRADSARAMSNDATSGRVPKGVANRPKSVRLAVVDCPRAPARRIRARSGPGRVDVHGVVSARPRVRRARSPGSPPRAGGSRSR